MIGWDEIIDAGISPRKVVVMVEANDPPTPAGKKPGKWLSGHIDAVVVPCMLISPSSVPTKWDANGQDITP